MGVFKTERMFAIKVPDLTPVANDVIEYFKAKGYDTTSEQTLTGGYDISISSIKVSSKDKASDVAKGAFKVVLGLHTALKISIESVDGMTRAKAGVGIFGQQAVPFAIAMFLFWPVLVTQIWGVVKQSKLDEESMGVIKTSLKDHGQETPEAILGDQDVAPAAVSSKAFCTECGGALPGGAKFCPGCGSKVS